MSDKKEKREKELKDFNDNFECLEVVNARSGLNIRLGSSTSKIKDLFDLSKQVRKEFFKDGN